METPETRASASGGITDSKSYPEMPYNCHVKENESISLSSGALLYTSTDISLPGKNGFDLVIQREYDSSMSDSRTIIRGNIGTIANDFIKDRYGLG